MTNKWSPDLLNPLIVEGEATPSRTVLGCLETAFPDAPPGDRQTILVGGLQTVLDAMLPDVELTHSNPGRQPSTDRGQFIRRPRVSRPRMGQ